MTGNALHINPALLTAAASPADANNLRTLLAACIRGERLAQRRLYDAHSTLIWSVIRRYTSDDSAAQDIHSEAFYRIFSRLTQYRHEGSFEGWMRRIAVHAVADYFRKHKSGTSSIAEDAEDRAVYHDEGGMGRMAYKELLALIHELPETQRAVFNLAVFEEYPHKEIAALLGITENNSRWHLNDARRRLKEKLNNLNR